MCVADQCGAYGKNWTCPPHYGSLAECGAKHQSYRRTEARNLEQFYQFCDEIRVTCPAALCLGSGGCRICKQCAWPESCRFPEKACPSVEGYGLFVTQVCRDNGLP